MQFAFAFVCQSGELQIKALLLAASLRKYWPATVELIACVPEDAHFGEISESCKRNLDDLEVRFPRVANPIGTDYAIGNKLLCLDVETQADRILFLDSDILALTTVTEQDLVDSFGEGFVAKPADLPTFQVDQDKWQLVYRACGAVMPDITVTATTSGELMAPYFNAGVIAVKANSGFGRLWSDCAARIDQLPDIPSKRPHLDQIALSVAAAKSASEVKLLSEEWNFPAHLRLLPPVSPKLCHYHWPEVIEREPALLEVVRVLAADAPSIAQAMRREPNWHRLGGKLTRRPQKPRTRNFSDGVITGIPRSGTSYLCRLLNNLPEHVVINEPGDIFSPLTQQAPGQRIACYYRDLRRRILDGEPIENKTDGGQIISDTAMLDVRTSAPIPVQTEDFMIWTKNTLAYLNRLPQLLNAMPEATFVACVRHPVDTISSWARTFPHLRDADVERFPVGYPSDPLLSPLQREQLAVIAACADLQRRRAMLWNYLASIILQHSERLIIVRLEDLAENPVTRLNNLVTGRSKPELAVSYTTRRPSYNTPAETLEQVASECDANASRFGYLMKS
jgi:hypothetical protein